MFPRLLLDTHVLIRWLIDSKKLSRQQVRALDTAVRRTEPLAISAISLLEIAILVSESKLRLKAPLDEFFEELQANPIFRLLPLTFEIASEVAALGSGLRDPTDHVIVATARIHTLRLLTSDEHIVESKLAPVLD